MLKFISGLVALVLSSSVNAALISDNFVRIGSTERLVVPFTAEGGVQTINTYSNHVEIIVSGVGYSYSTGTNDAFYGVNPTSSSACIAEGVPVHDTCNIFPTYQLGISTENRPIVETGDSDAENFITFIEDAGFIPTGTLPAYNSTNHSYHFVIDSSLLNMDSSNQFNFGVTDDYFSDNGGEFIIDVFQVQAVPIPSAVWLFGSGLISLFGIARRKKV